MKEVIKHLQSLLPAEQFVVTGSYALKEMGLPVGQVHDIDIILIRPTETTVAILKQMNDKTMTGEYPDCDMYAFEVLNTKINIWVQTDRIPVVWDSGKAIALSTVEGIVKAKKAYKGLKHILQLKTIGEFFYKPQHLEDFIGREQNRLKSGASAMSNSDSSKPPKLKV